MASLTPVDSSAALKVCATRNVVTHGVFGQPPWDLLGPAASAGAFADGER